MRPMLQGLVAARHERIVEACSELAVPTPVGGHVLRVNLQFRERITIHHPVSKELEELWPEDRPTLTG